MKICDCYNCKYRELMFSCLNSDEINVLCEYKTERSYKKGEIIVKEGDLIKEFFYLKNGLVKSFYVNCCDKIQIISVGTPMNFVSLLSVFSSETYKYRITALTDTTICCIDIGKIKELALNNGRFGIGLLKKVSQNADEIIMQKLNLSMRNMRGRVAYIILLFSEKIFYSNKFILPLNRKEIAQLIDLTAENVIRILSEFNNESIIKLKGKEIEILDIKKLKMICQMG